MTKQEMFNKSVAGLASQNFERAVDAGGTCSYRAGKKRCAWGWVDDALLSTDTGTVFTLKSNGIGLAAELDRDEIIFARELQKAHDESMIPSVMRTKLRELALKHNLTLPPELV